jgi:hypothetical protein
MAITSPTTVSVPDDGTSPIGSNEWNATVGLIRPRPDVGTTTFYVRTDGSDSNTGLANTSGGAFLTVQKAVDTVQGLDFGGDTSRIVTIQIADGTYDGKIRLGNLTGFSSAKTSTGTSDQLEYVLIQGNDTNPGNVIITNTTALNSQYNVIEASGGTCFYKFSGFTITLHDNFGGFPASAWGLLAQNQAVIKFGEKLGFKRSNPSGGFSVAVSAAFGARVICLFGDSDITFEGEWSKFLEAEFCGQIDFQPGTMTWVNTPLIGGVIYADQLSQVYWVPFSQVGSVDALTVPYYSANAAKITAFDTVPGSATPTIEMVGFTNRTVGGLENFRNESDFSLEMTQDGGTTFGDAPTTAPGRGNIAFNDGYGIKDTHGNEVLLFQTSSGSSNWVEITPSSGELVVVNANGAGANHGVAFQAKGDPVYDFYFDSKNSFWNSCRWNSTSAGALGLVQEFVHATPSAAANDVIINQQYISRNTSSSSVVYAALSAGIVDPAPSSELGVIKYFTQDTANGGAVNQMFVSRGVTIGTTFATQPGIGGVRLTNIELGHDTDTSLSRTTSGIVALEGVPVLSGGIVVETSSTKTLAMTDAAKRVEFTNSTDCVLTVPSTSSVNFPDGTFVNVIRKGAGTLSVTTGSGVTINSAGGARSISSQYGVAVLYKTSANSWILSGGIS